MVKKIIAVIVGIIVIAGATFTGWYVGQAQPELSAELRTKILAAAPAAASDEIEASGTIETEEVAIAALLGGRVMDVLVDEGDAVAKDAVLIKLDTADLEAQRKEAEAAIATAKANLASVKAGVREEDVAVAQAAVGQANAAHALAEQSWRDLLAIRDDQQELEVQIADIQNQTNVLTHQITQTRAQIAGLQVERDRYRDDGSDRGKTFFQMYGKQIEAMRLGISVTVMNIAGAEQNLRDLVNIRDNPLGLDKQINGAKGQVGAAAAAVAVAQAALDDLQAGATPEEIAVAEARVHQAEAALGLIAAQEDKMTLRAPMGGVVTSRAIEPGEMAQMGAPLLTIVDLDNVTLTVYVPENRYGQLQLGQRVAVTVDSFPNKTFEGKITHIADQAEFTPKNVQTQEERVNTVFAVKVKLPNPDHDLKPGMPADAVLGGS